MIARTAVKRLSVCLAAGLGALPLTGAHAAAVAPPLLPQALATAAKAFDTPPKGAVCMQAPDAQHRVVRIAATARPLYTAYRLDSPLRLVVDFTGVRFDGLTEPAITADDALVGALTVENMQTDSATVGRVVLHLKQEFTYEVRTEQNTVVLSLSALKLPEIAKAVAALSLPSAARPKAMAEAPPPNSALPEMRAELSTTDPALPKTEAPPWTPNAASSEAKGAPWMANSATPEAEIALGTPNHAVPDADATLSLLSQAQPLATLRRVRRLPSDFYASGAERFAVDMAHADSATPLELVALSHPPRLVLDLQGCEMHRSGRTQTINSPLVKQVRVAQRQGFVRVVFDLQDSGTTGTFSTTDRGLKVSLQPAADAVQVAQERVLVSAAVPQTAAFVATARQLSQSMAAAGDIHKRISLDVRDADIINVLRLISEETGENIIASDDVRGKITLKLRNVPADQALDTLLRTKGFDRVRQNNILRVAPAEAIQKERDLELMRHRSQLEVEETLIKMVTINYATASEIVDQIKPMLTGRGSVQVDARTNTLILQDLAQNVDRLVELTRRLDKQTPLVMIQARIVEANTSHMQDLGIQWGLSSQESTRTHNPTGLMFPGDVAIHGAADDPRNQQAGIATPAHYAVNLPAALNSQGGGLGFILGSANGSQILNLRLSAMETSGTGKIISSPEVATLDNKTARVSQGVEIPVSVVSAAGTNTRFIPAVLELEVTPHVTNDGTVLLKIKTQKSEADFTHRGAAGDPTIQKRFAETEVLVRDGDTSVIGGIYTRNTGDTYDEVPFLARIPFLGSLFRRHSHSDTRAELLVFITPRIINREESMVQGGGMSGGSDSVGAAGPSDLADTRP
jgi:type IV pilus assembly protein PilQ